MPLRNMQDLTKKLLILAAKFPDGFILALPDGSLAEVGWLYGRKEAKTPHGLKTVSHIFGVVIRIENVEAIFILDETEDNGNNS